MGRYKWLMMLWATIALFSCKKQVEVDPEIVVDQVFVEAVKSTQIDINYKLSSLGYEGTGVSYYKKSSPATIKDVNAVRLNGRLQVALQDLDASADYVFKVFYQQNGARKIDSKEYTVKTLAKESENFAMLVKNASIYYDENGNFTADIEGENLNNLNLSEFELKVNLTKLTFGYPVLLSGNKYKITITGIVNPVNNNNLIVGTYQGKEILFQTVPFVFDGDRYWLTYKPTNLRGYYTSVYNNELYYFFDKQIFKWSESAQRLISVGPIPDGTIEANRVGFAFEGQFFFPASEKGVWPNPTNLSDFYNHPQVHSYNFGTGKWASFLFADQIYPQRSRLIKNSNYFVHKNELYLTYSLADDNMLPGAVIKTDNFIFHYNKGTGKFEKATDFNTEIVYYHFASINNQMYLTGLVPVYDQGFKVSATLAIFKVSDNFTFEEIYRVGTMVEPLSAIPRYATVYDQKILIGYSLSDFLLFDPVNRQLNLVYLKNQIGHQYFGGFFTYNNKLHLNADLLFTSQKIYEISINKGR